MDKQAEFNQLQQELEDIKERIDDVDEKLAEANELRRALHDLQDVEEGSEALVPLSSGVFLKAELLDTSTLKVNIGSGTVVEKSIPETQEMVEEHIADLERLRSEIEQDYDDIVTRADRLSQEIGLDV